MKNIVILGSTGSIGENTLRVVEALSPRFGVRGLAARTHGVRVLAQAEQFGVRDVALSEPESARLCAAAAPPGVSVQAGPSALEDLASLDGVDLVVCATVGISGLKPVLAALRHGTDVALATKEVLVAAGGIVMRVCRENGAKLLPIDSEHSAVFQCLHGGRSEATDAGSAAPDIKRILLTASGGPFFGQPEIDLDRVTVKDALQHPRWEMGRKVTVDSATLMNKGLEVIEAHWLFGVPVEKIGIVIHPESIVHSLVEFVDGSIVAQMSLPDMRFAIQYALTYPERVDGGLPELDLAKVGSLRFEAPDAERFPCLRLAAEAAATAGTMPAVLNAANEVAVHRFLDGELRFSGIWQVAEAVMGRHDVVVEPGLEEIVAADAWARRAADEAVGTIRG